ncbi:MAG TPA: ADP-ribosylglycohydrolase family protein [bacterium]|nr:ADP-ribosylglycohydrolase family protein [bacterium]
MAVCSSGACPSTLERCIGTLFGLAIGDALGAPVEGWPRETIRTACGFIREYQYTLFGKGVVTDDTQMALALAESIVQERQFDPGHFSFMLGEWMRRHDQGIEAARGASKTVTLTTRALYKGTPWTETGQPSASNVPAVRIAPLALFHLHSSEEDLLRDVEDSCLPTNIDPLAIAGAKVMALAIRALIRTDVEKFSVGNFLDYLQIHARHFSPRLADCLEPLREYLCQTPLEEQDFGSPLAGYSHPEFCNDSLQSVTRDKFEILARIGTGKFVLESIPAALFCFLQAPRNFEAAVTTAVNAGGDTDSIAAMAGALSGAFNSSAGIPGRFLKELEHRDHLMDLATQLCALAEQEDHDEPTRWSLTVQVLKIRR